MEPMTMALLMGGMNVAQSMEKNAQDAAYAKGQAEMTKYSPWRKNGDTGKMVTPDYKSPFLTGAAGGMQGYILGQNQQDANNANVAQGIQADINNTGAHTTDSSIWDLMNNDPSRMKA